MEEHKRQIEREREDSLRLMQEKERLQRHKHQIEQRIEAEQGESQGLRE